MRRNGTHTLLLPAVTALLLCACVAPPGTEKSAAPVFATCEVVLAAAQGATVNWCMWSGSDQINRTVDTDIGRAVAEQCGVKLNRVPVGDTYGPGSGLRLRPRDAG